MPLLKQLEALAAVAGLALLLFAAYKSSAGKTWKENYEAVKAQSDLLRLEVAELRSKVAVLSEMVTSAAAVEHLHAHVDARFDSLELAIRGR